MASSSSSSPCAACKFLRRKCTEKCVFSPYFPPDQPLKFADVHKIFGASNIAKLLKELPQHQRQDAVNSLAYEAVARLKDPVYGCVGTICVLQRQVHHLHCELAAAHANLARYMSGGAVSNPVSLIQQGQPLDMGLGMGMAMQGTGLDMGVEIGMSMQGTGLDMGIGMSRAMQGTSLGMGMGMSDLTMSEASHSMQHVYGGQLITEQLAELARVGGGSYESLLAALGSNRSPINPSRAMVFDQRLSPGSDGANQSSDGGSLGFLSPH